MFFYTETEDATSHDSLNISTEGANKTQAAAIWGAQHGEEAVPWGTAFRLAGFTKRGSSPSDRPWTGQRL